MPRSDIGSRVTLRRRTRLRGPGGPEALVIRLPPDGISGQVRAIDAWHGGWYPLVLNLRSSLSTACCP